MRICLFIILVLNTSLAFAERVYLKDGSIIEGEIIEKTEEYMIIKEPLPSPFVGYSTKKYPMVDIKDMKTDTELKANGLVEYNGKWITIEQKEKIITDEKLKRDEEEKKETEEKYGKSIGCGFYCKEMKFDGRYGVVSITGKMTNLSGSNCVFVSFTVNLYDDNNNLYAVAPVVIKNFLNGETRGFSTGVEAGQRRSYTYTITLGDFVPLLEDK